MARPEVQFEYNEPVELSLVFSTAIPVQGRHGERRMYTLDFPAGHVMFLDLGIAERLGGMRIRPGEHFFICRRRVAGKVSWDAWLSPATEQMRARVEHPDACIAGKAILQPETDLERELAASVEEARRRRQQQQQQAGPRAVELPTPAAPIAAAASSWTDGLVAEANALVDAFNRCLEHANAYGNRVKPEDVRSLLTTAYIGRQRNGASHAA